MMQNTDTHSGINYTIIIPHKDIPKLLIRCLKSIPCREDLEIIIVDDDSSPEIVDFDNFPGRNRKKTKIIFNKDSKGAGHARNLALPHVRGKWLIFADADDFFNPIFEEKLDYYKDSDNDLIIFSANSVDSETYENANRVDYIQYAFDMFEKDKIHGEIFLKYCLNAPWSKMIKYKIVEKHNLHFDEVVMHNDVRFIYLITYYSTNCQIDRTAIYCVTNRMTSVSKNTSQEAMLARISVVGAKQKFIEEHNIDFEDDRHLQTLTSMFIHDRVGYKKGRKILLDLGYKSSFLNYSTKLSQVL
jgi:glycosyltransferase involved in cell wall biosynthesis